MTILDWEPPQNSLVTHALWRWTGALLQDIVKAVLRK